ncbi:putative cation symporter, pseudogene [Ligilactobacillus salivarius cp400]|nr:putative cation symporter, pseudogene [Ligilactobacillus salivarius cp400]
MKITFECCTEILVRVRCIGNTHYSVSVSPRRRPYVKGSCSDVAINAGWYHAIGVLESSSRFRGVYFFIACKLRVTNPEGA